MSAAVQMLLSLLTRQSGRLDLALTRGGFGLSLLVLWLPLMWERAAGISFAPYARGSMVMLSILLLVVLAALLAGDSVGDRRTGFLQLLLLSGTSPALWLLVRWWQILIGFASVWLVRLPFLYWMAPLGHTNFQLVQPLEGLLLLTFVMLASLTLLNSHQARTRQSAITRALVWVFALECLVLGPSLVCRYLPGTGSAFTTIQALTDSVAEWGLFTQYRQLLAGIPAGRGLLGTALLVIVVSVWANLLFIFRLYRDVAGDEEQSAATASALSRESRRSWDDALAWQAYCIHAGGLRGVRRKAKLLAMLALLFLMAGLSGYRDTAFGLACCLGFVLLVATTSHPRECLAKEIRDETVNVLLLTPHEPMDLYQEWHRGTWWLLWPEITFGLCLCIASFWWDWRAAPVVLGVMVAIMTSGPFLMLSPLVPRTLRGISAGVGVALFVSFCALTAIGVSALAGTTLIFPVLALPLSLLCNSILLKVFLPAWLEVRLAKVL